MFEITEYKPLIDKGYDLLMYRLSDENRRNYQHTFNRWADYCDMQNIPYHMMTIDNLIAFLQMDDLTLNSKKTRLAHIRSLLKRMHALSPQDAHIESLYKQAQLVELSPNGKHKESTHTKHALSDEQIDDVFAVYDQPTQLHCRNRALLSVLLFAGLRRFEAVALTWDDIDSNKGLIHVRKGKGNKERYAPLVDGWHYLEDWQHCIPDRTYLFCSFYKGDTPREDKPMSTSAVWRIVNRIGNVLGIEQLSPHDARRTWITKLLEDGANIRDVQAGAGHSRMDTTGTYAQPAQAEVVANRLRGAWNSS